MKNFLYILSLSIVLISCKKKQNANSIIAKNEINSKLILNDKDDNSNIQEKNFDELIKLIYNKKWIDLGDEVPCRPYSQSVTIKDGYFHEYDVEPSKYKIDTIFQIDTKTLGIKIENNLNRDVLFKVEILNFKEKLVKWSFNYKSFEAKPHDIICKEDIKEETNKPYHTDLYNIDKSFLDLNDEWKGLYYYKSNQTGKEFILDTRNQINLEVGGDQYGYIDQLKTVQVGDTLGLFHHKNISGMNYDEDRQYDFLKFYKSSEGKFYFEGKLPYLPKRAIEFEKVK